MTPPARSPILPEQPETEPAAPAPEGAPAVAPVPAPAPDRMVAPALPVPRTAPPRTPLGRWLFQGGAGGTGPAPETAPWYRVLWLTGVDYFSTLGYQPGLALLAAGALSPLATLILVLVTLGGALPVYSGVAARSFIGQGSIAMLERALTGWSSKLLVLSLLGFAATAFVVTMTLSSADAAQHIVQNPLLSPLVGDHRLLITLGLLALLAAVFLRGFSEAIGLAVAVGVPYIAINAVLAVAGLVEIARRPEVWSGWRAELALHGDWTGLLLVSALVFPRLALGLSGFETCVSVMPQVRGEPGDGADGGPPTGRIRATRRLLLAAAVIMSVMLVTTSLVSTLLVPAEAWREGGPAAGRVLAWLVHDRFGAVAGTVYDASTILILWFAGASAMAGLLNLVPRYLPRFGMAPRWVAYRRPLVLVIFGVAVLVTLAFDAGVEEQSGAYATGVLALILSAALAMTLASWQEAREAGAIPFGSAFYAGVSLVLGYAFLDNIWLRPDGIVIAGLFVAGVMALSWLSRWRRSTELRVEKLVFADSESATLWPRLVGKKVNLVPVRTFGDRALDQKESELRRYYKVNGPLAFLHVNLRDDRSEFIASLRVTVRKHGENYRISIKGANAIANPIAYVSELLDPISIFLGLTRQPLTQQALRYLLWGEGETGLLVYQILIRYWDWTPEDDVRPLIFLVSE